MSNTNTPFRKAIVKVQKSSAFDLSHSNFLTAKVGKLTPILTELLMPGDKISLGSAIRAQLPPLASNFYGKVDLRVNAFFVPLRLCYGGWKNYMLYSQGMSTGYIPTGVPKCYCPLISLDSDELELSDYLGNSQDEDYGNTLDAMPFLAYHRIWDDWYRDSRIQAPAFLPPSGSVSLKAADVKAANMPFVQVTDDVPTLSTVQGTSFMGDSYPLGALRQVNYAKDYFTNAFADQYGGSQPMKVSVALPEGYLGFKPNEAQDMGDMNADVSLDPAPIMVDGDIAKFRFYSGIDEDYHLSDSSYGYFSIPQLRSANSLQRFAEQNALAGGRYKDMIRANYGVTPADAMLDRAAYLGGFNQQIYCNSIAATTPSSENPVNPFVKSVGGTGGLGFSAGSGNLIDQFVAREFGYLMVLIDVMPHSVYSTGTRRYLKNSQINGPDFVDAYPIPTLCGVGHQPIYQGELTGNDFKASEIFGYTDRYGEFKWHPDECHGLLKNGQSLAFMALQRSFPSNSTPQINTSFLQVPTDAIDNISAVSQQLSQYGVILDIMHMFKAIRPLPIYSIPTLCDDIHQKDVVVERGGTRL